MVEDIIAKEISLNNVLNIMPEEYCHWTICLNRGEEGLSESLVNSDSINRIKLMQHFSYKKAPFKTQSFRVIHTKYCLQFLGLGNARRYEDWLFMGAFEVTGTIIGDGGHEYYNLKKVDRFSQFAERLIIKYKKHQGDKQAKLNIKKIESISVLEILPVRYINRERPFPGFKNFSIRFDELADIINNNVISWRDRLSSVQCIYAITDDMEKKVYVGSTYGAAGIWQRWSSYVDTNGHGGDVELEKIIKIDSHYAYDHFTFSILEYFYDSDEKTIIGRESKWKELLQTRILGYNKN